VTNILLFRLCRIKGKAKLIPVKAHSGPGC
jgi:hypothetical protein